MEGAAQPAAHPGPRDHRRREQRRPGAPDQRPRQANNLRPRVAANNRAEPAVDGLAPRPAVVPPPIERHIRVNFPVDEHVYATAVRNYNVGVVGAPQGKPHSHPLSAIERVVAEDVILEMVGPRLVNDIGGNASRHRDRPFVWSSCPRLTPADHIRAYSDRFQACEHTMQQATMNCSCGRSTVIMFVHSIYYVNPAEIVKRMADFGVAEAFSAHYEFRHPVGNLHQSTKTGTEYTYHVSYEGMVTAVAAGNGMAYQHPNPTWLYLGAYTVYYRGQWRSLTWSTERVVGLTNIVHFRLVDGRVPPNANVATINTLPLNDSLLHSQHYGKVQLRAPGTSHGQTSEPHQLQYAATKQVYSFGKYFAFYAFTWGSRPVVVPKDFVSELARRIAWQPRTPDTFSSLVGAAKREIKHYNISSEDAYEAVQHTVPVAFLAGVQQEIANLSTVTHATALLQSHTACLKHTATAANPWMNLLKPVAAVSAAALVVYYLRGRTTSSAVASISASKIHNAYLGWKIATATASKTMSDVGRAIAPLVPHTLTGLDTLTTKQRSEVRALFADPEFYRDYWLRTVIVAPIVEEVMKRCLKKLWWTLPLLEMLSKIGANATPPAFLSAFALHVITQHLPLPMGILAHALWNQVMSDALAYHAHAKWPVLAIALLAAAALYKRAEQQPTTGAAACAMAYVDKFRRAISTALTYAEHILPFRLSPVESERQGPVKEGTLIEHPPLPTMPNPRTWGLQTEGIVVPSKMPCVPASTTQNEEAALRLRACAPMPAPVPQVMHALRTWVFANFDDLFPRWRDLYPVGKTPYPAWNARFPPAIRKHHDVAREQLNHHGLTKADMTYQMFPKVEKLNKYDLIEDIVDILKPRAIQGCSYKATVATGPGCLALSKALGKMWNTKHFITYAYGSTPAELGKRVHDCEYNFGKPVWQDQDGVLYDAHVSEEMCELELEIADKLGVDPLCIKACRAQIQNHGVTKSGMTYTHPPGTRKSGTSGTSVFNGLDNGLTTTFAFCMRNHAEVKDLNRLFWTVVAGDDNNNVCDVDAKHDPPITPVAESDFEPMGFEMEITRAPLPNISFCSGLWWPTTVKGDDDLYDEESYCLGPKPGRLFARLGWSDKPVTDRLRYVRGNALGLHSAVQHIPLARELISKYLSLTKTVKASPNNLSDYHLLERKPQRQASNERVNAFLDQRYDLTLTHIREVIDLMTRIKRLPAALEHPVLTQIMDVDL